MEHTLLSLDTLVPYEGRILLGQFDLHREAQLESFFPGNNS
jgi:hypothetical protein